VTRYLVAAASRETVAAACEYLDRKLDEADVGDELADHGQVVDESGADDTPADESSTDAAPEDDDEMYVLTIEESARPVRDREAVSRAAQERVAGSVRVRTIRREGSPAREIVRFVRERDVDEVVLGPTRSGPGIGSTTRTVLSSVEVPVFVVPG
jgi:nucleotide-binding universal stress UspA family protein